MSGEKSEKPTEKRLRDARKKGQVAKSQDLTSATTLLASSIVIAVSLTYTVLSLRTAMQDGIKQAATYRGMIDEAAALGVLRAAVLVIVKALAPLLITLFAVALLTSYMQVGALFTTEAIKPDLSKLNPFRAFHQKFFKARPYLELVKTIIKMMVAGTVVGVVLWSARFDVIRLIEYPAGIYATFIAQLITGILVKIGIAFLVIGIGDFFLQRFLFLQDMKMSKQEIKEEFKEMEGDPQYKYQRKQIHREVLKGAIASVRKADVVVVNPTHIAVALQYDEATGGAPVVIAKGAEMMAAQIRRVAEEAGVAVVQDVPLARALYEVEIDDEIPEELYEATALVLRWVYELANKETSADKTEH